MTKGYYLAKFVGRNIIAFPIVEERYFGRAALRRYQPDTAKRALFRYWLEIATLFRLPGIWKKVSCDKLTRIFHFNLDQWLERISSKTFRDRQLLLVLVWPPEVSRNRLYVHLLNTDGAAVAFAKIAFDSENNSKLQKEYETLQVINKSNPQAFYVPSVIDHNMFGDNYYLIVEAVPENAKTYRASNIGFPSEAVKEYSGNIQNGSFGQVKESDWYKRFCQSLDSSSYFMTELSAISDKEKVKLCCIHGDFGPSNLLQDDGQLWIIDWEESCDEGPYLTDFVSFYLALNRKQVMKKPHRVLNQMISEFSASPHNANPIDIMMALAFLHGANLTSANMLIVIWPEMVKP